MEWDLAGYGSHPIDGDAGRVASLAEHLTSMTSDIQSQIDRIRALDSGDFWESSAGSADSFQEVVEDIPEKLELVVTRYDRVASALDTFHPVLASTKDDAEYWIQKAEEAQAEVERAESGIELMDDFADQAERDADAANEDREEGSPEAEPDQWQGEDYHATLEAAQSDLSNAVANVQSAVGDFEDAARNAADAINDAANDGLENEGGLFAGIARAFDDFMDWAGDYIEVIVQVLQVIGAVLAIIAMFVPGLNIVVLAIAGAVLLGTLLLYFDGRRTGWDVAAAALGVVTAGLGAVSALASAGSKLAQTATWANRGLGLAGNWVKMGGDGVTFAWEDGLLSQDMAFAVLGSAAIGLDSGLAIRGNAPQMTRLGNYGRTDVPEGMPSQIDIRFSGTSTGSVSFTGLTSAIKTEITLPETLSNAVRPQSEQSGFQGIDASFEGLDLSVSPGDIQIPEIGLPDLGPLDIPPMGSIEVPQISCDVNVPVGG